MHQDSQLTRADWIGALFRGFLFFCVYTVLMQFIAPSTYQPAVALAAAACFGCIRLLPFVRHVRSRAIRT